MAHEGSRRQLAVNIAASVVSFAVTMGINFFLTPYLVQQLGTEAYGFIGLANNFVQYATILTAALNSMSGRFISIAYHRGEQDKASALFSSVLAADLVIAGVMLLLGAGVVAWIDVLLNVPAALVRTVKITFGMTFLAYIISIVTAVFTTAAYVKNRIDVSSIRDIAAHLLKAVLIVLLFMCFPAQLYFVALAAVGSNLFLLAANVTVKKKLLPEIQVSFRRFELPLVRTLIAAGAWMSFAQLSNTLISGLDLLVCNLSLGAAMMGLMSIAKTIPGSIAVLINTIANVFAPKYTILYARGDIAGLVREVGLTSRLQSFLLMVPIAGFIVFGEDFYRLWQPGKTPEELRIISVISILSCVMYLFTCHTQALTMLNSVCNRMRLPVLVTFGIGLFSIAVVLVCLQLFALDEAMAAYLIAGVSSCLMSVRALVFIPVYAAHLLKQRWTTFYPMLLRSLMTFAVLTLLFMLMRSLFVIRTWLMLATACFIAAAAGYALSLLLLFGPKEIRRFLHRKQV